MSASTKQQSNSSRLIGIDRNDTILEILSAHHRLASMGAKDVDCAKSTSKPTDAGRN